MLKRNASAVIPLVLIAKADGTAVTTGTPAAYVTKDGGTQASVAASLVHEGNGQWSVALTAGEMDGEVVGLLVTHADAIPVHFAIPTTEKLVSELNDATAGASQASVDTLAGYVDTEVAAIKAKTDLIPAAPATEGTLTTIAGYLDTEIAAIKAKTDLIPADPADASDVATAFTGVNTKLDTIDGIVDDILTDTGTTLPATLAALPDAADITTAVWAGAPAGTPLEDIAEAVRDVDNTSPAADSLGAAVNDAGGSVSLGATAPAGWINAAAIAADAITAAKVAADADSAIAAAVWAAAPAGTPLEDVAGAVRTELADELAHLDADVSSRMATFTLPANFAALGINGSGHVSRVVLVDTTTANTDMRGTDNAALAATALSTAVWTGTKAGYLDAAITSVSTGGISAEDIAVAVTAEILEQFGVTPPDVNLASILGDAQSAADLKDFADAGYDPATNKVAGVAAAVTVGTNNDKTGYSLSATPPTAGAIADAVWDEAQSGHTTAGTFGKYLDDEVSGVSGGGGGLSAADVWAHGTRTLTGGVTVTTNSDKTGYVLGATGLDSIPMTLTSSPSTFREWMVWLTLRFRRTRLNKTTGDITVYGSTGSTVITTQATTDTETEETVGVTT